MSSARRPLVLLAAVPALLVGCSSAAPATTPSVTPPPAISANPTPVSTDPTPGPTITDSDPVTCPGGDYKATGFTATGRNSMTGTGTVRDVEVTFRDGRYEFHFDDDHPVKVTLNKSSGQVRIDGEIKGSYIIQPDAVTFELGTTKGSARLVGNGRSRSVPMREVAAILAPQGKGSAVCAADKLTITTSTVTWELVRDLD